MASSHSCFLCSPEGSTFFSLCVRTAGGMAGELCSLSMPQFHSDRDRIAAIVLDPSPELSLVLLAPSISWTLSCCLNCSYYYSNIHAGQRAKRQALWLLLALQKGITLESTFTSERGCEGLEDTLPLHPSLCWTTPGSFPVHSNRDRPWSPATTVARTCD